MNKSAHNKGFALVAIVALVVVFAGIVVAYVMLNDRSSDATNNSALPPNSERVNPDPTSGNSIVIDKVDPGSSVIISEVIMSSDGYMVVMKDNAGTREEVGRSSLLSSGTHQNVSISTSVLSDGDVIYVMLLDTAGKEVMDENQNMIEVQKNVGMVMSHYEDEY